jgi:hypothetical protein
MANSGTGRKSEYRIGSTGIITGHNAAGTLIGTASTPLSLNTWHKLNITSLASASGLQELLIDDVSQFSVANSNQGGGNTAIVYFGKAININSEGFFAYYDDIGMELKGLIRYLKHQM